MIPYLSRPTLSVESGLEALPAGGFQRLGRRVAWVPATLAAGAAYEIVARVRLAPADLENDRAVVLLYRPVGPRPAVAERSGHPFGAWSPRLRAYYSYARPPVAGGLITHRFRAPTRGPDPVLVDLGIAAWRPKGRVAVVPVVVVLRRFAAEALAPDADAPLIATGLDDPACAGAPIPLGREPVSVTVPVQPAALHRVVVRLQGRDRAAPKAAILGLAPDAGVETPEALLGLGPVSRRAGHYRYLAAEGPAGTASVLFSAPTGASHVTLGFTRQGSHQVQIDPAIAVGPVMVPVCGAPGADDGVLVPVDVPLAPAAVRLDLPARPGSFHRLELPVSAPQCRGDAQIALELLPVPAPWPEPDARLVGARPSKAGTRVLLDVVSDPEGAAAARAIGRIRVPDDRSVLAVMIHDPEGAQSPVRLIGAVRWYPVGPAIPSFLLEDHHVKRPSDPLRVIAPPGAPVLPGPDAGPRRIGLIASTEGVERFGCIASVVVLEPETWQARVAAGDVELLLLDLGRDPHPAWRAKLYDPAVGPHLMQDLVTAADHAGVAAAAWFRGDPAELERFEALLAPFSHLFGSPAAVARWNQRPRQVPMHPLLPSVCASRCHPFMVRGTRDLCASLADAVLVDGLHTAIYEPFARSLIESLRDPLRDRLVLIDSRWSLRAAILTDVPDLVPHVLGCVSSREAQTLRQIVGHELVVDTGRLPADMVVEQVIGAVVAGALPILVTDRPDDPAGPARLVADMGLGDSVPIATTADQVLAALAVPDDLGRSKVLGRRAILRGHTDAARLDAILAAALGQPAESTQSAEPLASVVVSTIRPDAVADVVATFRRQTWPAAELVLVVNTRHADVAAIRRDHEAENITVRFVSGMHTIGACLNLGILTGRGRYWLKMDDDDIYGDHHVEDLMLALTRYGVDVVGRSHGFFLFEATGALVRRVGLDARAGAVSMPGEAKALKVSGATLAGRRSVVVSVGFPETVHGSADTTFLDMLHAAGGIIAAVGQDGFVAVRKADKTAHTWRKDDAALEDRAEPFGTAQDVPRVLF